MARADRERRRSWCCRGRRRGAGVGGEERVPSRSRAASLGGACGPAGVRQFAERLHSAGLPALGRGWDSWPRRRSQCTDGRGVGACTTRRGSRLGWAGGRLGVAGARGGESHVSRRRRRRWRGGRGEPVAWRCRGLGVKGRGCPATAFWGLRSWLQVDVGSW